MGSIEALSCRVLTGILAGCLTGAIADTDRARLGNLWNSETKLPGDWMC